MTPTMQLRFVKRRLEIEGWPTTTRMILQQQWDLGHGEYEWRDVPVEDEQ